jgi:GT2 family glycosyltransferase
MSAPHDATLSVVIPHLNQPAALARCLRSLGNQIGVSRPFEIVVVDNGSERLPAEVCRSFSGVRLEREETPGPGPARNRGVEVSSGRVLAFIDADCIADPNWLAVVERVFAGDETTRVVGGDIKIAVVDPQRLTLLEAYESVYAYRQKLYIERRGFSGTGNLAVRREDLERIGPFAGIHVAEDLEWGNRARSLGYRIAFVPDMVVLHPARRSFAELYTKWDRHTAHSYERFRGTRRGRLEWLAYTVVVALSPLVESIRILRSRRVHTARERVLALRGVTRIRLYRARQMISLFFGKDGSRLSEAWNRSPPSPDGR